MAKRQFWKKMNNRGSALLTVILVVGFLTILATTLLYITGMDLQTKQADYLNKKSFYSGEVALEQIRANLMEDASKAAVVAYNDVSMQYVTLQNKDMRQLEYNKLFVQNLMEQLIPAVGGDDNWKNILDARFASGVGSPYQLTFESASYTTAAMVDVREADGYIRIKGLKMTYTDPATKLTTILSTDLDVRAPEIGWSVEGALQTLETGVSEQMAAESRTTVDASKCVKYVNWKKE